jgi:hypothetical protein
MTDRRGSPPALTEAQREDVGRVVRRRREIRQLIRSLEIELAGLPTNAELVERYGVTVTTLHKCAFGTYTHAHPLDRLTTITTGDNQ